MTDNKQDETVHDEVEVEETISSPEQMKLELHDENDELKFAILHTLASNLLLAIVNAEIASSRYALEYSHTEAVATSRAQLKEFLDGNKPNNTADKPAEGTDQKKVLPS